MFLIDNEDVKNTEITYNKSIYKNLRIEETHVTNVFNTIITSLNGCGKQRLVNEYLKKIFPGKRLHLYQQEYNINNYGSNIIKVNLFRSKYHIVFTPNNSALDKYIIQEAITDFCKTNDTFFLNNCLPLKIILIKNMDNLPHIAQTSLRRIMEKYSDTCRFIFIGSNIMNLLSAIQSRCIHIQLKSPTPAEICCTLNNICDKLNITNVDTTCISHAANRNMKQAIWMINFAKHNITFKISWQEYCQQILLYLFSDTLLKPNNLMKIRTIISNIFVTNIDPNDVFQYLYDNILKQCEQKNHPKLYSIMSNIMHTTMVFNYRVKNSTRYILHFEAYINKIYYYLYELID